MMFYDIFNIEEVNQFIKNKSIKNYTYFSFVIQANLAAVKEKDPSPKKTDRSQKQGKPICKFYSRNSRNYTGNL